MPEGIPGWTQRDWEGLGGSFWGEQVGTNCGQCFVKFCRRLKKKKKKNVDGIQFCRDTLPRASLLPWGKLGSCECDSGLLCTSGSCWWEEVGRCWPELAPCQVSASLRGAVPSLAPRAGQRSAHREEAEGPGRDPWMEASPGGPGGRVPDSSPGGRVCGGGFRVTHDEEMEEASI